MVNGLINFIKCRLVHQVVTQLLRFKDNTFNFEPIPWLQTRIMEVRLSTNWFYACMQALGSKYLTCAPPFLYSQHVPTFCGNVPLR